MDPFNERDTMIPTWSFSRLQDFEQCKYRAKLKYLDKIPEPERPLPKGKTEHANDRGSRIHEGAEFYVTKDVELLPELDDFEDRLEELKKCYSEGHVQVEGDWAYNRDWKPTAWNSADSWLRMKLDVIRFLSPEEAVVIDYKTGRRFGNEVKHTEQGQLYQLGSFLRFPKLEKITVAFWYLDHGPEVDLVNTYTREAGLRYIEKYNKRGSALTDCTEFKPNPNAFSCQWCPYKGGACEFGVTDAVAIKKMQARVKKVENRR